MATRDEEREISEGDLIVFEPDDEHWHGNTQNADSPFSHLAFMAEPEGSEVTVLEEP